MITSQWGKLFFTIAIAKDPTCNICCVLYLCHRLELERDLDEYETEQQVNAQYVEEFAMLTSEKVSYHRNMKKLMQGPTERQLDRKTQAVEAGGGGGGGTPIWKEWGCLLEILN